MELTFHLLPTGSDETAVLSNQLLVISRSIARTFLVCAGRGVTSDLFENDVVNFPYKCASTIEMPLNVLWQNERHSSLRHPIIFNLIFMNIMP